MPAKQGIRAPEALVQAQHLAHLFDAKFRIPIIGVRIGLDAVIGLIPVLGDGLMAVLSCRILVLAKRLGMPKSMLFNMLLNLLLDFALGLVPLLGDVLDVAYRANVKNVRIMEKWWVSQNHANIQANAARAHAQWQPK